MRRREFLMTAVAVAGVAGTSRSWAAQTAKLARIGVSSRGFGTIIKMGNGAPDPAARTLDFLDFAQIVADKFGVHNVELQHAHFFSTEPAYLQDLKGRVAKAKSQIVQISTEFLNSNASSTGPSLRQSGDLAKQWIDHAVALGCPRVQVNAGTLAENVRTTAIESLKNIDAYTKAHKVTISIENMDNGVMPAPPPAAAAPPPPPPTPPAAREGGAAAPAAGRRAGGGGAATGGGGGRGNAPLPPAPWQVISEVAKAAGVMVTPSLAGFPSEAERAAGLKVLYPLSNGNSHVTLGPGLDLAAAIKISQEAGYKGLYTIVTDGAGDGSAATKTALDALLKLI